MRSALCFHTRVSLPAYTAGALNETQSQVIADHLRTCLSCHQAQEELTAAPSRHDTAWPAQAAFRPAPAQLPASSTDTAAEPERDEQGVALDRARPGHRRTRTARPIVVGAVAAAAFAVGAASGYAAPHRPGTGGTAAQVFASSTVPAAAATGVARTASARDTTTRTAATVRAMPEQWGSWLQLTLTRNLVPRSERCRLVVVGRDGESQVAATWKADHAGTFTVQGGTSMNPDQIVHYYVDTVEGKRLVSVQA
jgi:hypothetical protein